ncbi:hypothetical protein ACQU0X_27945 [Pseudovibrio ascidiaceicola]|uniref:hypothetical protein n=1 Tax=Pseudovibrio ascidiaceicola TaxID=285279 RepID=UPI003D367224
MTSNQQEVVGSLDEPEAVTGPDFDALQAEYAPDNDNLEGSGETPEQSPGMDAAPEFLTEEQFYQSFKGMLAAPNILFLMKGMQPLQSLEITPPEEPSARAATDYLYKIAHKSPLLRWMIQPENETLQGLLAIGAFAVPKALAINAELKSRAGSSQKPNTAGAANDNVAGETHGTQAS